jgi:DNA-binding MarR family transcriptional regulator
MSEYQSPRRLAELPSWLAGQVSRYATRLVAEALAVEGMSRNHFTVLTALTEKSPMSQAEIGRRLCIDRSDLHAILNDLEARRLIIRVVDEADRRRNRVQLTTAGKGALRRLDRRVDDAQDALLEPLAASERRELRRLLMKTVDYHAERQAETI